MPKRTFQPKKIHRAKKCGFRARQRAKSNVMKRRRVKGRKRLTA